MTIRLRSRLPRKAARVARCWTASIVAPCFPIRRPRSSPLTVARISSSDSSSSTLARSSRALTTRCTMARTRSAGSSGSSAFDSRHESTSASARTRAVRPASSSPSSTTSKRTASGVRPGSSRSSALTAFHLASPSVAPSPSASPGCPSSATAPLCRRAQVRRTRAASPAPAGALLLLARRAGRRLLRSPVGTVRPLLARCRRRGLALRGLAVGGTARGRRLAAGGSRLLVLPRLDRLGLRHELLDEHLLAEGPDVRRDPVDDQAGLEVDDEEHEQEREPEHDQPLVAVGADGGDGAGCELGDDVEHDQKHEDASGRLLRQVLDEQEALAPQKGLVAEQVEQRQEERQREPEREAGAEG